MSTNIVSEMRFEIYRYLILTTRKCCLKPTSNHSRASRSLAILGTRREIHSEAASVLYSELNIVVHPGYILSLENSLPDLYGIELPILDVWRHNPLLGTGYTKRNGNQLYYTPVMKGLMDPHVFARFKKVHLQVKFYFDDQLPFLYINDDFTFSWKEGKWIKGVFLDTTLVETFVKVLSNSHFLNQLSVHLEMGVGIAHSSGDTTEPPFSTKELEQQSQLIAAAQARAAELFIDSGMLDPLLDLSNVKSFELTFEQVDHNKQHPYLETAKDLMRHIQGNCVDEKDS